MENDEIVRWITTESGKHIPIRNGESVQDAIKRNFASDADKNSDEKDRQIKANKAEADRLNANDKQSTQAMHQEAIKELASDKYSEGTYDIATKKTVTFDSGYQVTFCQIGDKYTAQEYQGKVDECIKISSNGKTYAGKFEGTPEISFHCNDRAKAVAYARANNQISIWDWAQNKKALEYAEKYGDDDPRTVAAWINCEIKTGGTGRRD